MAKTTPKKKKIPARLEFLANHITLVSQDNQLKAIIGSFE
jgi:hypothetical protein